MLLKHTNPQHFKEPLHEFYKHKNNWRYSCTYYEIDAFKVVGRSLTICIYRAKPPKSA